MNAAQILVGDALATLRTLPEDSVQCCVTSPPYWGVHALALAKQPAPLRFPCYCQPPDSSPELREVRR